MGTFWMLIVAFATISVVAGDPQLFSFQIGNSDDSPSDSDSEPEVQRLRNSPPQKSRGPRYPVVIGGSTEDSDVVDPSDRPGPLNYEPGIRPSNPPSNYKYGAQNLYEDDSSAGRPQASQGYRSGPPPGFRGRRPGRRPRPGSNNDFESSNENSVKGNGFGYPRGPRGFGGYGRSESLPARIGRGIMGFLASATGGSPSLSLAPNYFSPSSGQAFGASSNKEATFYLAPPPKDSPSFYGIRSQSAPSRGASLKSIFSRFGRGDKLPIQMLTSESSRLPQEFVISSLSAPRPRQVQSVQELITQAQSQHPKVVRTEQGVRPSGRFTYSTISVPSTSSGSQFQDGQVFLNPYSPTGTEQSSQVPISQQQQLVMTTGPDGNPIILQIPAGQNINSLSFQPQPQQQFRQIQVQPSSPIQFTQSQQVQSESPIQVQPQGALTLASRPEIPFPSLTNPQFVQQEQPQSNSGFITSLTVPQSQLQTQYVGQQGPFPGFSVTGAQSIYPEGQFYQHQPQQIQVQSIQSQNPSSVQLDSQFQQVVFNQLEQQPQVQVQQIQQQPQQQQSVTTPSFIQKSISESVEALQQQGQQQAASTNHQQVEVQQVKPSSPQGSGGNSDAVGAFSTLEETKP